MAIRDEYRALDQLVEELGLVDDEAALLAYLEQQDAQDDGDEADRTIAALLDDLDGVRRVVPAAGLASRVACENGYAVTRPGIRGRSLLHVRTGGLDLVKRLKDAEGRLDEEARFWAGRMATMLAPEPGECVTYPPGSGKRTYSLAGVLAAEVARVLGRECQVLFRNPTPRGNRANMVRKLQEATHYEYAGPRSGARVLVVDDHYCTGMTARRCVEAAVGARLSFLVLCRS